MTPFFDLHSHMLYGVDDGAKTYGEMIKMLEEAYADGTRALCLTSHYSPYLFGETEASSRYAFEELSRYAEKQHPDLSLYLGHELGYHGGCLDALADGRCRTVAGGRYVLTDFPENVSFFEIKNAMETILRAGYLPILAHAERYRNLRGHLDWLEEFREEGGAVQVNASSVLGSWGRGAAGMWKKLIKRRLVDAVASDGHNLTTRPPTVSPCIKYLSKHCEEAYIADLVWNNPQKIVRDEPLNDERI